MSKTVRYTLISIFSICTPLVFLFLPAFMVIRPYSTESTLLSHTLERLIKYPEYISYLIEISEYTLLIQVLIFLLILFVCLLAVIFALARNKGGVIVTSALGLTATLTLIGFYMQNAASYASYMNITPMIGPGTILALILRIVNLILAATEKPEVVYPPRATYPTYPVYPGFPVYPTNPTPPTNPTYPAHPTTPTTPVSPLHHAAPHLGEPAKPTANHRNTINSTIQSAAQSDELTSNWTQF